MNLKSTCLSTAAAFAGVAISTAAPVPLQQATATHSQSGFSVDFLIDGVLAPGNATGVGWALDKDLTTSAETAVFETVTDLTSAGGFNLTFSIFQGGFGNHSLGKFRLSYTTDARTLFADDVDSSGDVTANWITLTPSGALSDNPNTTFTFPGSDMILAQGGPDVDDLETQTITASTGALVAPITGFRLEALADAALPDSGPGRSNNGNIVLRELSVDAGAVPEPASFGLLALGAGALLLPRRR